MNVGPDRCVPVAGVCLYSLGIGVPTTLLLSLGVALRRNDDVHLAFMESVLIRCGSLTVKPEYVSHNRDVCVR